MLVLHILNNSSGPLLNFVDTMLAYVNLIHGETDTKKGKKEEENEANIAKFLFKQNLYVMTLIHFLTYCFIDSLGIYHHAPLFP